MSTEVVGEKHFEPPEPFAQSHQHKAGSVVVLVERLNANADTFAEAYENPDLDLDVKEALFKTQRGRVYRALFVVEADGVFILRVRGFGQASVTPDDIEGPRVCTTLYNISDRAERVGWPGLD